MVYFICEYCDDEQAIVLNINENTIEQLEENGCIFVNIVCTHDMCGEETKFIYFEYVTGIEL